MACFKKIHVLVMGMSLTKFEVFSTIVELGSLTKAAETLGLTQSAVSHAIASLESEWGFSLLVRGRSGISLTANGERVLRHVREILRWREQLAQEIATINGLESGTVRIGTFSSVSVQWLPEIMKQFQLNHPAIEIKLLEGDYEDIDHWISSGAVDFGFVSLPVAKAFDILPLRKDRMLCMVPAGHPLEQQTQVQIEQLAHEWFIMPTESCDNDVRRIFQKHKIVPRIRFELADDQAIISMVQNGLGVSILPEMVLFRIPDNVSILSLEGEPYRSIGIAAQNLETISPAAKTFIRSIQSWLA
ncbi:UNVERIFIED_CONTAM: DNA-binding transcriptional LysR family regulator [Brevibacillus sp. OAP136]